MQSEKARFRFATAIRDDLDSRIVFETEGGDIDISLSSDQITKLYAALSLNFQAHLPQSDNCSGMVTSLAAKPNSASSLPLTRSVGA